MKTEEKKSNNYIPAQPSPNIRPGADRNATDQGHRHRHLDEIGPDTVRTDWEGTSDIDTYDGPNRSQAGDSMMGRNEYEGFETERGASEISEDEDINER